MKLLDMTNLTDMGCVGNFYEHKDKMPREVEVGEMEKYRLVTGQWSGSTWHQILASKCEGKALHKCRCHPSIVNPQSCSSQAG